MEIEFHVCKTEFLIFTRLKDLGGLELEDPGGPFQSKLFYDSIS